MTSLNETTTSVTKNESTNTYTTSQEHTPASTQTSLPSQEGITTPQTTKIDLSSLMTTHLPSTVYQNADIPHQGLVVIAGDNFTLRCSAVRAHFRWGYGHLGSRRLKIFHNGFKMDPKFSLAAKLSANSSYCDVGDCILRVSDFHLVDAGFFTCVRSVGSKYWSITMLGKYDA